MWNAISRDVARKAISHRPSIARCQYPVSIVTATVYTSFESPLSIKCITYFTHLHHSHSEHFGNRVLLSRDWSKFKLQEVKSVHVFYWCFQQQRKEHSEYNYIQSTSLGVTLAYCTYKSIISKPITFQLSYICIRKDHYNIFISFNIHRSSLYSALVKNAWSYTATPLYSSVVWCLIDHTYDVSFARSKSV